MKILVSLLLFTNLALGQVPLDNRLKNAEKRSKKPAKKLAKNHADAQTNSHLNGDAISQLLKTENLTNEQMQASMRAEHDYLTQCLAQDHLTIVDRKWIKDMLDIVDDLWEPYFTQEGEYVVTECSEQAGITRYTVKVERDPDHPGQFFIQNFYNMGFNYKAVVNQSGSLIEMKEQTLSGFNLKSTPVADKKAFSEKNRQLYPGDDSYKCFETAASNSPSQTLETGDFNLAYGVDDGNGPDHCFATFSRPQNSPLRFSKPH